MVGRNEFHSSKIENMKMWCNVFLYVPRVVLLATQVAVANSTSAIKMLGCDLTGLLLLRERQCSWFYSVIH
jgi:hypothetical protein